jgi:hypothetical protein
MTILPVVLYVHETCSLILREEQRMRIFENRVLMNIWTKECLSYRRVEKTA